MEVEGSCPYCPMNALTKECVQRCESLKVPMTTSSKMKNTITILKLDISEPTFS